MDQTCQGQHTTSRSNPTITLIDNLDNNDDDVPTIPINNELSNLVYMTLVDTTRKIFTDQTRRFPITSNSGNT
jgi:hypothetical protein